jgi:hypothetical protein
MWGWRPPGGFSGTVGRGGGRPEANPQPVSRRAGGSSSCSSLLAGPVAGERDPRPGFAAAESCAPEAMCVIMNPKSARDADRAHPARRRFLQHRPALSAFWCSCRVRGQGQRGLDADYVANLAMQLTNPPQSAGAGRHHARDRRPALAYWLGDRARRPDNERRPERTHPAARRSCCSRARAARPERSSTAPAAGRDTRRQRRGLPQRAEGDVRLTLGCLGASTSRRDHVCISTPAEPQAQIQLSDSTGTSHTPSTNSDPATALTRGQA